MKLFATVSLPLLTIDLQSFQKSFFKLFDCQKNKTHALYIFHVKVFWEMKQRKGEPDLIQFFLFKFGG